MMRGPLSALGGSRVLHPMAMIAGTFRQRHASYERPLVRVQKNPKKLISRVYFGRFAAWGPLADSLRPVC